MGVESKEPLHTNIPRGFAAVRFSAARKDKHRGGAAVHQGPRSRRLMFAFAPPADAWPSALLRGRQLMEIVGAVHSDTDCHAIALGDLTQLRGEWVILTKSALFASNRDTILGLRALGHRLIADFVDLPINDEVASSVDFLLASSVYQERFFKSRFPEIPTMYVTHHVDLRMPMIATPTDRARFGYFGIFHNCLHANEIADLVCIVDTSDDAANMRWMSRLSESSAHYAIRGEEKSGTFKPFLKGFIAAHCGVPIIVASSDEEAQYYLGTDYPFVVGDTSVGSVREHIRRFAAEYATSPWKLAVEVMRAVASKSSRQRVECELRALLDAIW
jgi:hypothetical protein